MADGRGSTVLESLARLSLRHLRQDVPAEMPFILLLSPVRFQVLFFGKSPEETQENSGGVREDSPRRWLCCLLANMRAGLLISFLPIFEPIAEGDTMHDR